MSSVSTSSVIYGAANTSNILNIKPQRARLYWDTIVKGQQVEEDLDGYIDDIKTDQDIVDFIEDFEDETGQEYGVLCFMAYCINSNDKTSNLEITSASDDDGYKALGVFEKCAFPWELAELYKEVQENNITLDRVNETINEHWYLMFQEYPVLEDLELSWPD